ncbi:MAG: hypothetical protein ABIF09_18870, partial [Gemmatimonadota bacterium]
PTITAFDGSSNILGPVLSGPLETWDVGISNWQTYTVTITNPSASGGVYQTELFWGTGGGTILIDNLQITPG